MATPAWQRKEGQNPAGGLNAKGRASYKAQTGGTLKAPVKGRPTSPEQVRRKGSFLSRMGGSPGPERKPNGDPTRLLLSLQAWGADSKAEAKSMGRRLLEQYAKMKASKK